MSTVISRPSAPLPHLLGTGLVLAALPAAALGQEVGYNPNPLANNPALSGLVRGREAVERLGGRLAELAVRSQMSAEEFERHVRNDDGLWVDENGDVIFVDPFTVDGDGEDPNAPQELTSPNIPISQAFNLHSRPGANHTIYLDFDGHHSVNNGWGHDIMFSPYNSRGTPSSFTNSELREIIDHWRYIAEDFAIFDVDVTTEEPPLDRLMNSGPGDTQWGVRDVHTQPKSGFGNGIGGVAGLWTFSSSLDRPVFSFNKGSNNGSMTGSHEVGHSLGLVHDGLNSSAYHPGKSRQTWTWGPIMGAPFGAEMVQWSNGDYAGSTSTQLDINTIASATNGLNIIEDDHGDTVFDATPIVGTCPDPSRVQIRGTISSRIDVDTFKFVSVGGQITFAASRPDPIGNVDCKIEIYDAAGVRLGGANQTLTANALMQRNLGPGEHTLLIDGGDQPGLYSDYGSRGHYILDLTLPVASHFTDLGNGLAGSVGTPILTGNGWACEGTSVGVSMTGALPSSTAFLAYGVNAAYQPLLGGVLVPNIGAGGGFLIQTTDALGAASASNIWPAGVPSGGTFHFQYWVQDPGAPQGFAASNAIVITAP